MRRLDDPARGRRDDGHRRTATPATGRRSPTLDEPTCANVLYFALFPNALVSLHPDYVMLHTLWPRAPGRTDVICEWFFEPATIARADFDPSDAVGFWDMVNGRTGTSAN